MMLLQTPKGVWTATIDCLTAARARVNDFEHPLVDAQLGRSGKPREAMLQLAEMARLGVQPDNIAATALLDACARNRKMEMASSVFEELFGAVIVNIICWDLVSVSSCSDDHKLTQSGVATRQVAFSCAGGCQVCILAVHESPASASRGSSGEL